MADYPAGGRWNRMLHWLSTLACSIASICLKASARSSDRCRGPTGEVAGQTITIAGAVGVLSLPPRPACRPEAINPLLEIARPSCASSEQVNFRYWLDGEDAICARPELQLKAAAVANVTMPIMRMTGSPLKATLQYLDQGANGYGWPPQPVLLAAPRRSGQIEAPSA
jgi:hypothetical protein